MATLSEPITTPEVRETECFIGGKWVPAVSGKTFATVNPATEEVICEVAEGDAAEVVVGMRSSGRAVDEGSLGVERLADCLEQIRSAVGEAFTRAEQIVENARGHAVGVEKLETATEELARIREASRSALDGIERSVAAQLPAARQLIDSSRDLEGFAATLRDSLRRFRPDRGRREMDS